jgi:hypothetical protein
VPSELGYPTTDIDDYEFEWHGGTEYPDTTVQMTIVQPRARSIGWLRLQGSVRSSLPERLQNERAGQPVGAPARGSDAWDSPIEMDHRDVPGCLCPSGIAALGVFAFR